MRYLQPHGDYGPIGHTCTTVTLPSVDDNLKINIEINIIAIGEKYTQHKINKYITSSAP